MSAQALEVVALPGDGIGVEVTEAAITVLQAAARRHGVRPATVPAVGMAPLVGAARQGNDVARELLAERGVYMP